MVSLKEIEEVMSVYIKHQTHPLAVKLLRQEDGIPEGAKSPVRDFGVPFSNTNEPRTHKKQKRFGLTP